MIEGPPRLENLHRLAAIARIAAILGVGAVVGVGAFLMFGYRSGQALSSILGVGAIAVGVVLAAGLLFVAAVAMIAMKIEASCFRIYDLLRDLQTLGHDNQKRLEVIAENVQLSDMARTISHRERERNALRMAINEEIIRGDTEAAYALVELLEARHGYKSEAARLRAEVDLSLEQESKGRVHDAVHQVGQRLESHDWDLARREMDRLLAQHPNNAEVRDLPKLFAQKRNEHKRKLLKQWDQSVQRNEVDRGIAILKELDQYLTRNEAAALEESARGVFRTKLHNLGLRFSFAVSEHNWADALAAGKDIIDEFPNSRMAQEVRERWGALEQRASGPSREPASSPASQG